MGCPAPPAHPLHGLVVGGDAAGRPRPPPPLDALLLLERACCTASLVACGAESSRSMKHLNNAKGESCSTEKGAVGIRQGPCGGVFPQTHSPPTSSPSPIPCSSAAVKPSCSIAACRWRAAVTLSSPTRSWCSRASDAAIWARNHSRNAVAAGKEAKRMFEGRFLAAWQRTKYGTDRCLASLLQGRLCKPTPRADPPLPASSGLGAAEGPSTSTAKRCSASCREASSAATSSARSCRASTSLRAGNFAVTWLVSPAAPGLAAECIASGVACTPGSAKAECGACRDAQGVGCQHRRHPGLKCAERPLGHLHGGMHRTT